MLPAGQDLVSAEGHLKGMTLYTARPALKHPPETGFREPAKGWLPEMVSTKTSVQTALGLISSSNSRLCLKCSIEPQMQAAQDASITALTVIKAHLLGFRCHKIREPSANPATAKGTHCTGLSVCPDSANSIGMKQKVPKDTINKNFRYQDSITRIPFAGGSDYS